MPDLSTARLTLLLSAVAERCDRTNPSDGSTLDDAAIRRRVEDWCSEYLHDVAQDLRNSAALCEQNGLGGVAGSDADQLRSAADDLVCRWTDLLYHDLAHDATPEQIAEWEAEYGAFPLPGRNEPPDVSADRWGALFGRISTLSKDVRVLLQSVDSSTGSVGAIVDEWSERILNPDISDAIADAANAVYRPGEDSSGTGDTQPAAVEDASGNEATRRLLSVFTGGLTDERFQKAAAILQDENIDANEKLTRIDAIIPFPATASAKQLGKLVGVSKQRVAQTDWWIQHRKGEKADEVGRRRHVHAQRAKRHEGNQPDDDD